LTPSKLFASGMVLQREKTIPVWGTSTAGDSIIVDLNGVSNGAKTDANGKWRVVLPSLDAGGPYVMKISRNTDVLTYTDVYIGDVFLASGQSNMEFTVSQDNAATTTIDTANNVTIREFKIAKATATEPSTELTSASWRAATSANVGSFSAVAYYFAAELQKTIKVPIGIINSSYGGSRIEAWMNDSMLGYDENDIKLASGETERQPTLIYNKMLNPIIGVPVKAMLWYQGESNADNLNDPQVYGEQFKTLITSWRSLWGMGDIPFVWFQLPNEGTAYAETNPQSWDAWPQLRANQSRALSLPNTAEVTLIDLGEVDIHPKIKKPFGHRLNLAVRKLVYGENIVASGPRYVSHSVMQDGKVKIEFSNIGGGLEATNTTSDSLKWFAYAGTDSTQFKKADAVISGNSVIVSCSNVSDIKFIRYAWECNPAGVNFYNTDGFPAVPFYIKVPAQGFNINSFTTTSTNVERGTGIVLKWNVTGASKVLLNGAEKDSIVSIGLWPKDTIVYTLQAVNRANDQDTMTKKITVYVIDPLPRITIASKLGNVATPGETVTITATATAPGGGTVTKVEFYVDDVLAYTDETSPYEFPWTEQDLGSYVITGVVTNEKGATTTSTALTMYVNNLVRVRYEAELATLSGTGSIVSSSAASNKKYMQLQDFKTLTFAVNVPSAGDYQTIFRYLTNYESPKEQILSINGTTYKTLRFEAPDKTTWMDYGIMLPLKAGDNTITISTSWGWMSFDYIDILGATVPVVSKAAIVSNPDARLFTKQTKNNIEVIYNAQTSGAFTVQLLNLNGIVCKSAQSISEKGVPASTSFDVHDLPQGLYIISLSTKEGKLSSKAVIMK